MSDFPTLPGYRIERLLGRGGMAAVYLATQLSLGRVVALKVLDTTTAGARNEQQRFLREAQAVAEVHHPNVVTVHDVAADQGQCFMAMEYLRAGSLTQRLSRGLRIEEALSIIAQVGSALSAAHARGIVHRDVKPDNVLFRDDTTPVLTDFGIAQRSGVEGSRITEQGILLGTPAYMSPEQIDGKGIDARSDLYSLGVLFYELLIGETPFAGGGSQDQLLAHLTRPVPRLPERLSYLQPVIDRALAKRAEHRYRDVDQMLKDLGSRLLSEPKQWSSDSAGSPTERLRSMGFPSGIDLPLTEHPTMSLQRPVVQAIGKPRVWITVVVLMLAGLGWLVMRTSGPDALPVAEVASPVAAQADTQQSLAVLPFRDLSQGSDLAWVAEGLSEELITALSRLPELRVAARSSAFRFRGDALDVRDVGTQLGVRHLVEGSVRVDGDQLLINAQLVETATGFQVWARTFEYPSNNILAAQKAVASAIAESLFQQEPSTLAELAATQPTTQPAAYEAYLQSRQAARDGRVEGHQKELELLRQAIEIDPGFARAYATAARSVIVQHQRGALDRETAIRDATGWLAEARRLAPQDAETLLAEGSLRHLQGDLGGAEAALRATLEADPNHTVALGLLDYVLWEQGGREAEELPLLQRTAELDPLSAQHHYNLAELHVQLGDYDAAERTYARIGKLAPTAAFGFTGLGRFHWMIRNDPLNALVAFRSAHKNDPRSSRTLAFPAIMLVELGMPEQAAGWLAASDDWEVKDAQIGRAQALLAWQQGRLPAASEWMFAAARDDRSMRTLAAHLALQLGDGARAVELLTAVLHPAGLDSTPNRRNLRALISLAALLREGPQAAQAKAALERALEFVRSLPARGADGALLQEAEILAVQGKTEQALSRLLQLQQAGIHPSLIVDGWRPQDNPWLQPLRDYPEFANYLQREEEYLGRMQEALLPVAEFARDPL